MMATCVWHVARWTRAQSTHSSIAETCIPANPAVIVRNTCMDYVRAYVREKNTVKSGYNFPCTMQPFGNGCFTCGYRRVGFAEAKERSLQLKQQADALVHFLRCILSPQVVEFRLPDESQTLRHKPCANAGHRVVTTNHPESYIDIEQIKCQTADNTPVRIDASELSAYQSFVSFLKRP